MIALLLAAQLAGGAADPACQPRRRRAAGARRVIGAAAHGGLHDRPGRLEVSLADAGRALPPGRPADEAPDELGRLSGRRLCSVETREVIAALRRRRIAGRRCRRRCPGRLAERTPTSAPAGRLPAIVEGELACQQVAVDGRSAAAQYRRRPQRRRLRRAHAGRLSSGAEPRGRPALTREDAPSRRR